MVFAGVLVVGGLLMESWPELRNAIREWRLPNLIVTGGVIVVLGVLLEVVLGIFITQRANRAQSEANERVARAEQTTAEANLARVRIEEKLNNTLAGRTLPKSAHDELAAILSAYLGHKRVDVFMYDSHVFETLLLGERLNAVFLAAGWDSKLWYAQGRRLIGKGVVFCIARELTGSEEHIPLQLLSSALGGVLFKIGIESSLAIGGFSAKELPAYIGEFRGPFPWEPEDVAMLRVQVGEKQLISEVF